MNSKFEIVPLGTVADPVRRVEVPVVGNVYRQVGVKLWGAGAYEREPIDGSQTRYDKLFRVETGDIIVNKIWARNGSVAVIPSDLAGCYVSSEFPTFVPLQHRLNPRWFHWITKTRDFWSQCDEKSRGTSGKNRVRPERFLEIEIPLPRMDEQDRIVSLVDRLDSRIETAIQLRRNADLEGKVLSDSMLHEIIARHATDSSWKFGPIEEFAKVNPPRPPEISQSPDLLVSFVPMSAVDDTSGSIVGAMTKKLAEVSYGHPYFENGDVIFARITPCMENGKAALSEGLMNGIGFGSTEFHILRAGPDLMGRWLHRLVRRKDFRDDAKRHFKGTAGQQRVPQSFIEKKVIPVPSIPEQERILIMMDQIEGRLQSAAKLQTAVAKELRDIASSLLVRATRGTI